MKDNLVFQELGSSWPLFQLTGESQERLTTALSWAFGWHGKTATHYAEINIGKPDHHLTFYWTDPKISISAPFLVPVNAHIAAELTMDWLKTKAYYGDQPDHDGSNHPGWHVYVEEWGHVDFQWQAICAVKPRWQMYGK